MISIFDFGSQSGGEGKNYGKGKARETNERPREMVPIVIEIPSSVCPAPLLHLAYFVVFSFVSLYLCRPLHQKDAEPSERAIKSITWAFTKEQPSSPLLVYARKSRVYVLDLKEHLSGPSNGLRFLKGHGGVSSLTVLSSRTSICSPSIYLSVCEEDLRNNMTNMFWRRNSL